MEKMRWGFLGSGKLLDRWIKGFRQVEDAETAGIASRTIETARRRARELGISDRMLFMPSVLPAVHSITIAGSRFDYSSYFMLYAYRANSTIMGRWSEGIGMSMPPTLVTVLT